MRAASQLRLLLARRFLPYWLAQLTGAFDLTVLKSLLLLAAVYPAARSGRLQPRLLGLLAGALFVLPVLVFSGLAGELADRCDRARIMRIVKAAEIAVMALAAGAVLSGSLAVFLASVLLMGVHASFLAPAKYALLPQMLHPDELLGGNALLEIAAFAAIVLATLGTEFYATRGTAQAVALAMCAIAVAGALASLAIPSARALAPRLRLDWQPWRAARTNLAAARARRTVWLSILGLAWFWFYGMLVLTQLPLYARFVLGGGAALHTLLLTAFATGLGAGALLCAPLSGRKVEIGLVPLGSIGLTLFTADLAWVSPAAQLAHGVGVHAFLAQPHALRLLCDLGGVGLSGGLYVVPLRALVQQRAPPDALGRVFAVNSILNALCAVLAAGCGAAVLALGGSVSLLLFLTALLNALAAAYIYSLVPEFLLRLLSWLLVHIVYRIRERGLENIPPEGAALLVSNHVSYVDALVISAACPRPIRFVMENAIFSAPVINLLARGMKAVPIAPRREDARIYEHAFATVAQELRDGQLVCIFPEGRLTTDGALGEFRPGLMRILAETAVPVVPIALSGLWGSVFSRHGPRVLALLWHSLSRRIGITVGTPVPPADVTPQLLRERVLALRADP